MRATAPLRNVGPGVAGGAGRFGDLMRFIGLVRLK
jgi:hypothetical protein